MGWELLYRHQSLRYREPRAALNKSNGRVPADKIIQIDLKGQSHNMGCFEIIKSIFYELNATDPYCLRVHYNV